MTEQPPRPKGAEIPRIWTRPLRRLGPKTSLGFRFVEFCEEVLDWHPLPWQRWWAIHALELVGPFGDQNLRFRTVLTLVGRQCGKTSLLKALALFMMFDGRARLVLGAAQTLDIAREAWAGAVDLAEHDPELAAEIAPGGVKRGNTDTSMTLANGARYRITAASRQAGRGLSVDLLILDELREQRDWDAWSALSNTTRARPNGLIVAISNAGDDYSVVLNQLREAAIAEKDQTVAIFEWSAPDGCALDDWKAIAQALPGLGYTWTYEAVLSALATDPPGVFRTEILCQRVESVDTPIAPPSWDACADLGMLIMDARDKHFCLDVAPDGAHVTLAAAALTDDGRVRVAIVDAWDDIGAVRTALPALLAEFKPRSLGWFPNGPAAALLADMNTLRHVKRVEIKSGDVPAVCQGMAEQVNSRMLLQPNDPLLNAHVLGSRRLVAGDGWRFARRGGHADAAYAAAGAIHLARAAPRRVALRLHTSTA